MHRVAELSSTELRRCASPQSAVPRRPRRSWRSPWCSPCAADRSGANPVLNGAPQRLTRHNAAARCRSAAEPRVAASRAPPPAARASSEPPDLHLTT
jgi:hypothetical protein